MLTSQIGFYYLLFSYFWSFTQLCAALGSHYVSTKSCIGFEKVQKWSHHNSILNTNDSGNVRVVFSHFIFEKVYHEVNAKYIIISNIISDKKLLNMCIFKMKILLLSQRFFGCIYNLIFTFISATLADRDNLLLSNLFHDSENFYYEWWVTTMVKHFKIL